MPTARRGWGVAPDVDLGLEGKIAWVLGGSSGIGRAAAASLAAEGARVAISARREEELRSAATEIARDGAQCIPVVCDVDDAYSIDTAADEVVRRLGPIDILVANSGGPPAGPFDSFDDDALYGAFTTTTASAWRLIKAVVPGMKSAGGGCLIFITSSSTKEVIEGLLFSNTMRAAVVGMSKTLSKELGNDNIRTVCVAPGRIETPRLVHLHEATAARTGQSVDEVRAAGRSAIPLDRYGSPDEVGDVVAFLASERASYITGISVLVDGGLLNGVLS